jgi:hypothetical protein
MCQVFRSPFKNPEPYAQTLLFLFQPLGQNQSICHWIPSWSSMSVHALYIHWVGRDDSKGWLFVCFYVGLQSSLFHPHQHLVFGDGLYVAFVA